ncbi:hypothetical protein [Paenibacillus sp. PAMC21692]|uniref:hypothetical protein n=1 Tax=Paenibacillus sp. PAMC21692 TaxID=2762320 RepID=UPI001C9AE426|nr:hypothetical protein [Paenibacillus sp. PAMC21692]
MTSIAQKKALIIRSASFQQLDRNLQDIQKALPDYSFHMLTHEHGVKLAEKYASIEHIYVYPHKNSFHILNRTPELRGKTFDMIIIPVTNISGAGFMNVFLFSLSIKASNRYQCNMLSEMKRKNSLSILAMLLLSTVFKLFSILFTTILTIPVVLLLLLKFGQIQKK